MFATPIICRIGAGIAGAALLAGPLLGVDASPAGAVSSNPSAVRATPTVQITSDTTYVRGDALTVKGTGPANTTIRYELDDIEFVDPVTADADGHWQIDLNEYATDTDQFTLTLTAPKREPVTVTFTAAPDAAPTPVTVTSETTYTRGEGTTVHGTGPANTTIRYQLDDIEFVNPVTADADGHWQIDLNEYATDTDQFTLTITAPKREPVTVTFTAEEQSLAPITVSTGTFVQGQRQKIEGTAQPGARVDVYSGSKYLMNVTADNDGTWNYTTGAPITTDTFTRILKTRGTDDVTFTLTAEKNETAPITVTTTTFIKGQKQKIEGTAQPGARVDVYAGSMYLMNVTADATGDWRYTTGAAITGSTFTRTLTSAGTDDTTFTLIAR
ncbi:hypothetical protein Q7F20_18000 [Curtobacterium sp. A7_M15]|uniref:hypothetical protein n=1 Tax=Curtobacterium sp. A7_M15 TaxID=3065241 RepID=UPI002737D643|nr:hypothetical protein [Curtobacterium sp. A7_M15]MDP4335268.1 hypothetical protein [Curtobacterium sp. A7_M15]